jgi:2,4-diketo-3-deoxy-L-fuconate hydrolase
MKLVRFGEPGRERPGVWMENRPGHDGPVIFDVRAKAFDIRDYDARFFTGWGLDRLRNLLREDRLPVVPAAGARLGPPVARPGKIMCLGVNYREHAAEFGAAVPSTPIVFAKAITALAGPFDPIVLPARSRVVDAEVELAVVIGKTARRVSAADAFDVVAGYTVMNDVTDREAQRAGQQWFYGKGADTFGPLGPFLVTADEIPDPHRLRLYSKVNGQMVQDGNTGDMLIRIADLIEFLSRAMTLEAGDIISTGTPSGVGSARQPPMLLRDGDTCEVGVEGVGVQINPVRSEPA